MRTIRHLLASLAIVVGTLAAAPAPASADADVCTGVAQMSLSYRAGLYQVHTWSFADMVLTFSPGGCVAADFEMRGWFSGWCGFGTGYGMINGQSDHTYSFQWVGTQLVFLNPLTASITLVEAPGGGLCATGNATRFIGTGVVAKQHLAP